MESHFDITTQSAMDLVPEWLTTMNGDYREEEDPEWPLVLLKGESRKSLFNLCVALGVNSQGVAGQACRLTERYFSEVMRNVTLDSGTIDEFSRSMGIKTPLLMAICIQLAAKMKLRKLNAKLLRACLSKQGLDCSVNEINEAEFAVYKTIEFRIPLWTSVETAQSMAVHMELPKALMSGVEIITNLTESNRDNLDCRIQFIARTCTLCKKYSSSIVRTVHLVAGCVLATTIYFKYTKQEPLKKLACLVKVPPCYINNIAQNILSTLKPDKTSNVTCLKRKLD